ncbi:MAG: crossover junction endodeoxyribonuclease RuvC [Candidatus Krumholzibacteria bacterium]|nr:crossover junction endodeoxyribonuclease RuvC [Candidatus Krumholzibacteria bacterium]
MVTILGVDPGSACTGWGVVRCEGNEFHYVASGAVRLLQKATRQEKLRSIHLEINSVISEYNPTHFAIEDVFFNKNPKSTMILGEARGAAILAAALAGVPVFEYSAREVKQSVTGNGAAHKSQVSFMLGKLLRLEPPPTNPDESDALAVALCHAFKNAQWSIV